LNGCHKRGRCRVASRIIRDNRLVAIWFQPTSRAHGQYDRDKNKTGRLWFLLLLSIDALPLFNSRKTPLPYRRRRPDLDTPFSPPQYTQKKHWSRFGERFLVSETSEPMIISSSWADIPLWPFGSCRV
jgi:hypothetical protein